MESLRKFVHQVITNNQHVEDDILIIYQRTLRNVKSGKNQSEEKEKCINEIITITQK